jgi:ABC-type multidrug transport system ATPase subunit
LVSWEAVSVGSSFSASKVSPDDYYFFSCDIDGETDSFIQSMLRTKFGNTTQMTVAHRLNTIMDFDFILVMDQGTAAEFGSPSQLLEKHDSLFTKLVDATGPEGSKALRRIVKKDIS